MRLDDLDYDLPPELIAQVPAARREDARMLVVEEKALRDDSIANLHGVLTSGDLLVLNNTRVLPAKLAMHRETGGAVDALVLEPSASPSPGCWNALLRGSKRLREGDVLRIQGDAAVLLEASLGEGMWSLRPLHDDMGTIMKRHGRMPLPPYITRSHGDPRADLDEQRYQTTFAEHDGAAAAPTAGLHVTSELLSTLQAHGIESTFVTLHVGLGTFAPVRCDDLDDHSMHEERYEVGGEAANMIQRARTEGRRVVAVGTTTVRTLESAAARDGVVRAGASRTRMLIQPGYSFQAVDALLTNFHLPRSTLLALVAALVGRDRMMQAYEHAVREKYRFYSYGDAMFLSRDG